MDIALTGNPKTMTAQPGAAAPLPTSEGAPIRETQPQGAPSLIVTIAPESAETGGIPPAEIEKAIVRDDALGKLVDKAFGDVEVTRGIQAKIADMLSKPEHAAAKETIDNQSPSDDFVRGFCRRVDIVA